VRCRDRIAKTTEHPACHLSDEQRRRLQSADHLTHDLRIAALEQYSLGRRAQALVVQFIQDLQQDWERHPMAALEQPLSRAKANCWVRAAEEVEPWLQLRPRGMVRPSGAVTARLRQLPHRSVEPHSPN
jgi:hypothetical protein